MKLSQFKEQPKQTPKQEQTQNEQNSKTVEQMYDTYKNMNQSELMNELKKNVSKQKQDGSFDYNKLSSTIEQVLPYLSQDQQKNLMSILNQIK